MRRDRFFQVTAQAAKAFSGQTIGRHVRNGPKPWDTFRVEMGDESDIHVCPGIEFQVESAGEVFRMRAKGTVLLVSWPPTGMRLLWRVMPAAQRSAAFLETCVGAIKHKRGLGVTTFIAKTLGVN